MHLVDTSIWIEVFRKTLGLRLEDWVDFKEVVICPPIIQEILQGIRDERSYLAVREALFSFPILESPLELSLFEEAARLYRQARRAGYTVRSSADCLIAACAIRHQATVLHYDRDFEILAKISRLQVRRIVI